MDACGAVEGSCVLVWVESDGHAEHITGMMGCWPERGCFHARGMRVGVAAASGWWWLRGVRDPCT